MRQLQNDETKYSEV